MDDVDRLFECFKCGVTPPQSALKERKKRKVDKSNRTSNTSGETSSLFAGVFSPGSERLRQQCTPDAQLCMEQLATKQVKAVNFTRGKQISPVVFYGSPHGVPAKRPTRLLQLLREIRHDLSEDKNVSSRRDIWVTFPKQDQAINFAKEDRHARLFSYQDHVSGQRRFLVTSYKEFWRRYKNMESRFRHHYEVIQQGLPCHLYFDLEFNRGVNVDKNGDEMVDILISVIFDALLDKYSMHGEEDWVVELDSSTEEKFSRHLIIRIPKVAFKDNSHAGAFVAEICSRICSARDSDCRLQKLFISKDSSSNEFPHQLFVDTAVYSRNRCFRLALSSKAGKKSYLLPTKRFKCKNLCEEDMFMDSLICKMDDDCHKLLICRMDLDCVKTLCFDSEVKSNYKKHSSAHDLALRACTSDLPNTYFIGKSPFPVLDTFVESVASIGNISGKIRTWYWFSEYGLMVYNMSRSRYCERIGREHKSNNVMYIVDFKRAVYYQKCYDPDCKEDYMVGNNDVQHQLDQNEMDSCDTDQRITDSCKKDGWWLEAIKVADDIERNRQTQDPGKPVLEKGKDEDEEDYEWWMAVEQTASQIGT
ncbi:hypothetical protein AQUCO_03800095v1 [Aquilegia coerulea]|uniref:DNA-directed primase/polymerase protein n=1 Tax=Aquilegia coerulea TaxID=218851 RepID=A0A2G5CSL4_AQUCA|nr:hypothetical protein AQUCO_03800095v1 [Aquilegia coerulea]